MGDGTPIEWTDATVNVISGCTVISPGCTNCYAMRSGGRNLPGHPSTGLTVPSKAGHVWTGEVRLNVPQMLKPLSWRKPRRIFWNAHGDMFHENVPDDWIDRCFAVMALTSHHTHQVLTKRSARMRAYFKVVHWAVRVADLLHEIKPSGLWNGNVYSAVSALISKRHLPNVWLGVSAEDETHWYERLADLRHTPAAVRWVSAEPLLGLISDDMGLDGIDWIVAGGESGPGARPMHPDWARSLRNQCAAANVPFLFKQWGEWGPDDGPLQSDLVIEGRVPCAVNVAGKWQYFKNGYEPPIELCGGFGEHVYRFGKKRAGRLLDGVKHDGFPA